ncbi:MAG: LPS assembly protein LptD [Psychromonas sp.]|nr:LPS assembly protein LptD [Psychromonas sp.]
MIKYLILLTALFSQVIFAQRNVLNKTEKDQPSRHKNFTQQHNDKSFDPDEAIKLPRNKEYYFRQCYQAVPPVTVTSKTKDIGNMQVYINALTFSGYSNYYIYKGGVDLVQGDKYLTADVLKYHKLKNTVQAKGNVNFINGNVTIYADAVQADLKTKVATFDNVDYQFHGKGGRGHAKRIYSNGKNVYEFKNASYTACPPNDTTWTLNASTLNIDKPEDLGSAWNAVLKLKKVPVFYFPYISYPLSHKRKTGFLFPVPAYSDINGLTYKQPLYLNLAPNMDATITPNYMQNRGILLSTEFRYLLDNGAGSLQAEYLGNDKLRKNLTREGNPIVGSTRYLFHWDHNVNFARNWNFNAIYNKVSDDSYFNDITTPYGNRSDNQLLKTAQLRYNQKNWNSQAEIRSFQILGNGDTPYKVLPRLSFDAYKPLGWRSLQFDLYSEITKFDHNDPTVYKGTRIYVEPKLSLPLNFNSFFVNSQFKYMLSYYQQELPEVDKEAWYKDLTKRATRILPSIKIDSGLNLERNFSAFNGNYTQTLVPQFQYLYVPYRNQKAIGIYDTTTLFQDYYGLFRDNIYSGYDRIADANQFTLGMSSSIFNEKGKEKIRFAVGQNFYIKQNKVTLPTYTEQRTSRSSIIGEFDANVDDDYFFHSGLDWDQYNNIIKKGNATIEKRWLHNTYAQLNYRYIYISDEEKKQQNIKGFVNQLGSRVNWSIDSQWTTFADYYYDLEYQHTFESIIGVQYQSCCWSIGVSFDKHMLAYFGDNANLQNDYETEHSFHFNFALTGLGGVGTSSGSSSKSLFNYGRPFYLQ